MYKQIDYFYMRSWSKTKVIFLTIVDLMSLNMFKVKNITLMYPINIQYLVSILYS